MTAQRKRRLPALAGLRRLPDWECRLAAYVAAARNAAEAGGADGRLCALVAAGAVEAMTGTNPALRFRGRYARVARDLEGTIERLFAEVPPALAQRGDVALMMGEGGPALGICFGADALFLGEEGGRPALVRRPRSAWVRAWAVGREV